MRIPVAAPRMVKLFVVLAQQTLAIVVAIRRPHDRVDVVARGVLVAQSNAASLNLSYFVARYIWRSRSVFPLPGRAHRLQRRKSLRGLPGLMDPTFDLRQTALN